MKSVSFVSSVLILALAGEGAALAQVAAHGYVDVLVHPAPSAAAAAAAVVAPPLAPSPVSAAYASPAAGPVSALSEYEVPAQLRLALDAARLDADAKLAVIEQQRSRGGLDEAQYHQQMDQYQLAVQAYDQLPAPGSDLASEEQVQALQSKLLDFNRSGGFRSVLADVGVHRGDDGSVLAERASLETSVTQSVADLRASLPADQDTRPAQAYLDELQRRTLNRIRAQSAASDAIPFADATVMVRPLQQTQALMLSGPAPSWLMQVKLKTSPANAVVVFFTESGYHRNYVTDASRTVMRGLLEYIVFKPGYKTVQGKELDLVSAVTGEFSCTLVPKDDPDPALPCQME